MGRRCDGDGDDGATVPHRLGEVIHSHGSDGAMARRCDGDDSAPVDKVIHHRGSDGAMARRCDGATVRCDGAVRRCALPHCGARKMTNFGKEEQMKLPGWKRLRPASRDSE